MAGTAELKNLFDRDVPEPSVPLDISLLAGEIAYNLRAALDYLTGTLSRHDSPSLPGKRRNQFPIESTPQGFANRRNTFLVGIDATHVQMIEQYQPYNGCAWSARLAELSNLDKHNALIVVLQAAMITITEGELGEPHKVVIEPHLRLDNDDRPLYDVMNELIEFVGSTVAAFSIEIEGVASFTRKS